MVWPTQGLLTDPPRHTDDLEFMPDYICVLCRVIRWEGTCRLCRVCVDAARYRWIRQPACPMKTYTGPRGEDHCCGSALDTHIDAALRTEGG